MYSTRTLKPGLHTLQWKKWKKCSTAQTVSSAQLFVLCSIQNTHQKKISTFLRDSPAKKQVCSFQVCEGLLYYLWSTCPYVRANNLDTYIQAYIPHESSGDSSNQPCTVQCRPVQSSTAQYSLVPPSTVQYRPVQFSTSQEQSSTAQYSPIPPSTVQYRPVQPKNAKYSPAQPSTAKYSQRQPSTAKYSLVPPSTAKYSPVPPSTAQ